MAVIERTLRGRSGLPLWRGWSRTILLQLMAYVLAFLAIMLVGQQTLQVGQRVLDDIWYGYPRSASVMGYVGHGDERYLPTLIETINLNGQISVLVIPGGDVQQLQVLEGPYVVGSDGVYATALPQLRDVNDDDHVDLLVTVRDEVIVYINEDGAFRPITMEERAMLAAGWYED